MRPFIKLHPNEPVDSICNVMYTLVYMHRLTQPEKTAWLILCFLNSMWGKKTNIQTLSYEHICTHAAPPSVHHPPTYPPTILQGHHIHHTNQAL